MPRNVSEKGRLHHSRKDSRRWLMSMTPDLGPPCLEMAHDLQHERMDCIMNGRKYSASDHVRRYALRWTIRKRFLRETCVIGDIRGSPIGQESASRATRAASCANAPSLKKQCISRELTLVSAGIGRGSTIVPQKQNDLGASPNKLVDRPRGAVICLTTWGIPL